MQKNILIHIPHASLYIPEEYKKETLLSQKELEEENKFMCDYKLDELLEDKTNAIIFPYSRIFCDVERFKDESEMMNQYGMGYIYTKTSTGKEMFQPSLEHREEVNKIYDDHHKKLDETVTEILKEYGSCTIIDLHSYSSEMVKRLFGYENVPDICIGIEPMYYSEELTNYFVKYFRENGYSVEINYPYQGSIIPNKFYGKEENIVSIMIEFNKRIYEEKPKVFKKILNRGLNFK